MCNDAERAVTSQSRWPSLAFLWPRREMMGSKDFCLFKCLVIHIMPLLFRLILITSHIHTPTVTRMCHHVGYVREKGKERERVER